MDRCPTELWSQIYSLACTDNGFTGRSLSHVSKYVREISKTTKWQSISLHGPDQIFAFAAALQDSPPEQQRVRHLFVSDHNPRRRMVKNAGYQTSLIVPGMSNEWFEYSRGFSPKEYQKMAREYEEEAKQRRERVKDDIMRTLSSILAIIALTVRTLGVYLTYPRSFVFVPVPLPVLTELYLHGQFPYALPNDLALRSSLPSLRYLHLAEFACNVPDDLLLRIATSPLTHLRISGIGGSFQTRLYASMKAITAVPQDRDPSVAKLPSTLNSIVLQPCSGRCKWRRNLNKSFC